MSDYTIRIYRRAVPSETGANGIAQFTFTGANDDAALHYATDLRARKFEPATDRVTIREGKRLVGVVEFEPA